MASSLVKIDIHLIFHIKSTSVTMRHEDLPDIFSYMAGIIKGIGGASFTVGGTEDHIHILSSLPKNVSIADFVRTIKSESSKWMKTIDASYANFAWQDGYGAFSVSPSILDKTKAYIQEQKKHHERRTFRDEYRAFLVASGVSFDERYVFED
jgi:REP element-mobilizing transposase RayT